MTDVVSLITALRRPRLLVEAARHGLAWYDRPRHLRRLLGPGEARGPREAVLRLYELEHYLDEARRAGMAGYSVSRHVEVLIALMAEARDLTASRPLPLALAG